MTGPPTEQSTTSVTLLVAHGSRNPRAADAHEQLCVAVTEAASAATGAAVRVVPAYLELTEPSIPDAIDAAVVAGARTVQVLPHFLGPGNHVLVDIPEIVEAARSRHPGVQIELSEHLGADPALVDLLAARVLA
jgi:sirohydrochlorin cobaltochelatase